MNANNSNRLLNSLVNTTNAAVTNMANNIGLSNFSNAATNFTNSSSTGGLMRWIPILVVAALVITAVTLGLVYRTQIEDWWRVNIQKSEAPAPEATPPPAPSSVELAAPPKHPLDASHLVEKVLPLGGKEVFSVSSNKYTYYDAEPMCRALGAELATYDQVKEAWGRGADWCNYGWVKGQMAVYPTSKDTYDKLQAGPAEQAGACGKPGVNGGFFDNPELRFGVTCYGPKPEQSQHDEAKVSAGLPMSPGALEIDKKIQQFKRETQSVGILPFNSKSWNN